MFLPIYTLGHPLLRKKSEDFDINTYPEFDKFMEDMWYTMEFADGVGLAAPQIGKNIRLFVIDARVFEKENPKCKDFRKAFINAHIIERGEEKKSRGEGCLSVPGIHEEVARPTSILMEYMDEKGNKHKEEFNDILAWIIQHEYDHLEGIMFIDYLSPLRKRLLKSKINAIQTGKFKANYKVVTPK